MARQPEHIIPFRPFGSGRKTPKTPQLVIDDRRQWFGSLSGQTFSNEVQVPAMGAWANPYATPIPPLTEALRLLLPRPEPITLSFHPWWITTAGARLKYMSHLYAEVEPNTDAIMTSRWGRIIVEWGTGQSRAWTYFDAGPGSLQLPSVSDVRVSGWSYSSPYVLSVNAQVGYAHNSLKATWSFASTTNVSGTVYSRRVPNFSETLTSCIGYRVGSSDSLNQQGLIRVTDGGLATVIYKWLLRPAIAPNPQAIPYPPVDVPLSGAANEVEHDHVACVGSLLLLLTSIKVKV